MPSLRVLQQQHAWAVPKQAEAEICWTEVGMLINTLQLQSHDPKLATITFSRYPKLASPATIASRATLGAVIRVLQEEQVVTEETGSHCHHLVIGNSRPSAQLSSCRECGRLLLRLHETKLSSDWSTEHAAPILTALGGCTSRRIYRYK